MHEVSIAMGIMDIILEEAKKEEASLIKKVNLQIGEKAGVVIDALRFAIDTIVQNTLAEKAEWNIESIPFRGECIECGHQFISQDFLVCQKCGSFAKLISGQELKIISIEIE